MKLFLKKLYICLFSPKRICFYFGEKIYKSILQLLLLALITITPMIITLSVNNRFSNSSYRELESQLMEKYSEVNVVMEMGKMQGVNGYAFLTDEAIVYINPNDEILELNSLELALYHVIEFKEDRVEVLFMNTVVSSFTYKSLGIINLDFNKINDEASYHEFDKFMAILNHAFKTYHVDYVVVNSLVLLFDVFLTIIISSLILAFIVKLFNPMLPFAIRFKGALDCQVISLLCILFMLLFNFEVFRYIGIVFSAIYLIIAVIQAYKIEIIMRGMQQDKE